MVDMKKLKEEAMQRKHAHFKQQLEAEFEKNNQQAKTARKHKVANQKSTNTNQQLTLDDHPLLEEQPKKLKLKLKFSLTVVEILILLVAGLVLLKLFNPF